MLVEAIETGNASIAIEAIIEHIWAGFDLQIEALNTEGSPSIL